MSARHVVLGLAALAVASCAREPRSPSYFQGHPDAAKAVVSACQTGATRGQECLNAQAGIAAAARDARMATYRKSF
jgi:hypothetical protein